MVFRFRVVGLWMRHGVMLFTAQRRQCNSYSVALNSFLLEAACMCAELDGACARCVLAC